MTVSAPSPHFVFLSFEPSVSRRLQARTRRGDPTAKTLRIKCGPAYRVPTAPSSQQCILGGHHRKHSTASRSASPGDERCARQRADKAQCTVWCICNVEIIESTQSFVESKDTSLRFMLSLSQSLCRDSKLSCVSVLK